MGKLPDFFETLRAKAKNCLGVTKGSDFEDRLNEELHGTGYSRLLPERIRGNKTLKAQVLHKHSESVIDNPLGDFRQHFILQPYGSQNYPDFLVLDGDKIVCIEVKFSKGGQPNPVWNSGLPRPNGIYIFGATGERRDLTFFRGRDVISAEDAKKLHDFFGDLKKRQNSFNQTEMSRQPYGFAAYVRKAFEQKALLNKSAVTNFFTNPDRKKLEDGVIGHLRRGMS